MKPARLMKLSQLSIFTRAPFQVIKAVTIAGEKRLSSVHKWWAVPGVLLLSVVTYPGACFFPDVTDCVSPAPIVIPYMPGTTHWFTKIDLGRIEVGEYRAN